MLTINNTAETVVITTPVTTTKTYTNPFTPKSANQILAELDASEKQIAEGKCKNGIEGILEIGKAHGFV